MIAARMPDMQMPASTGCRYLPDITMNTFSLSGPASGGSISSTPASPTMIAATSTTITHPIATRRAVGISPGLRIAMNRARMCG